MPQLRKLSPAETAALEQPPIGAHARVVQEYDAYLAGFAIGDYGRAELIAGERRPIVRRHLHAAARRRGFALRFQADRSPLIFHVEAASASIAASLQESVEAPPVEPSPAIPRHHPRPPRQPRRQSAAERYRASAAG